jgi:GMP reductase
MKQMLSYKDVVLLPSYSEIRSRDNVNTEVDFLGFKFKSPALPANMACCIDFKSAELLGLNGYFYILHRFYDYYNQILPWLARSQGQFPLSISVGIKQNDLDFLKQLSESAFQIDFVTIDVAHGHHILVKETCEFFHKLNWKYKPKLIVGNFGSSEGVNSAIEWGADAVKVGLSMGAACTTYNSTGVGTPMYSIVNEIHLDCDFPIIADGQIREIGDIAKAIHAGANMVMIGSMFASCEDSPAEFNFYKTHKLFYGSASSKNKGYSKYVEGKESYIECNKLKILEFHQKIEEGLRSSMSYAGVDHIYDLKKMEVRQKYDQRAN